MPLTPRFELSQTPSEVIVTIFVPTVRVTNIEVVLEEEDSTFHFHASPYLLKLHFSPFKFAEDGNIPAEYDPSQQTVHVRLAKSQPADAEWPNLQLTARLLQPKEIPKQWLHSVQTNNNAEDPEVDHGTPNSQIDTRSSGYGFGGMFQNIFTDYCRGGLAHEMLQLPDPEATSSNERTRQRADRENADFDENRYMQDFYIEEDYLYPMVMEFHPFWEQGNVSEIRNETVESPDEQDLVAHFQEMQLHTDINTTNTFSSDDRLSLATIPYPLIPKRLLDLSETSTLWAGLLDLLLAFVYDHLTTMGDPSVESAWTITTLSASLSWLDPPKEPREAIRVVTRRMLIYPYWRNWDFCRHVWKQTLVLLEAGLYAVVKALLMTRGILEKSESYYVGNKLFLDPYLYWIQQMDGAELPKRLLTSLSDVLKHSDDIKQEIALPLLEIERKLENDLKSSSEEDESSSDDSSSSSTSSSNSSSKEPNQEHAEGSDQVTSVGDEVATTHKLLDDVVGNGTSILSINGEGATNEDSCDSKDDKARSPLIQEWDP